ncbi:polysaccharide deacetylase family protein [Candidatus Nitrosotalea sp. FS]|uniref:polysaccharide deacetylase family protein n=1 Tax=Candidatus Nitrosotalea sp. FS TaxID=2341021 RepID=UPI00140C9FEA|nr:polysaccharide deacetylase family protein [Candidatus Nitrosotalea sp. FS]
MSDIQMKIMDVFQKKNASLSIGITGYNLTQDSKLVSYLQNNLKPGHTAIEMANHGWRHEDFATMGLSQQITLMNKTNQELNKMFGKKPNAFLVPYGMYDNDTLKAIKQLKMNVISSSMWSEDKFVLVKGKITANKDSLGLYHIPSMTEFESDTGNETYWTNIPKDRVIDSINSHITKYGYDVFLIHPQNFATLVNGQYINTVDTTHLDELASIIDYVKSKHIHISTISEIAGLDRVSVSPVVKPVATTPKPVNATVSKPSSDVDVSNSVDSTEPPKVVKYVEPNGSLTMNVQYPSADPANARMLSMKIYRDFDTKPYMELPTVSDNPYTVTLPMYHQYKIQTFVNSMLSSVNLVTLDSGNQNTDVNIPWGGTILVSAYFDDGQTPISGASVSIRSQDNKTRATGVTGSDGSATRFSLPSTNDDSNYYIVDVKINNHLTFSSDHVTLQPESINKIKLVAPWHSMIENLITVKVYNQTKVLPSNGQTYAVQMYDDQGNKLSESPVNIHGEGYFWSMQVGDYVFKVVKASNGTVLGNMFVTVDGTKNNFDMTIQNHASTAKPVLN